MKPIHLLALAGVLTALAFSGAGARSSYGNLMFSQYKLEKDAAITKTGCKFCHNTAFGGGNWNKFGDALKTQWQGAAEKKIQNALYLVLKENQDSDSDGYSDVLEVLAKTLPGDAKSKPNASISDLEAQLKKLGGVEIFKPAVVK
jgi:hypothetical protein